jgi:hypothetical protein
VWLSHISDYIKAAEHVKDAGKPRTDFEVLCSHVPEWFELLETEQQQQLLLLVNGDGFAYTKEQIDELLVPRFPMLAPGGRNKKLSQLHKYNCAMNIAKVHCARLFIS